MIINCLFIIARNCLSFQLILTHIGIFDYFNRFFSKYLFTKALKEIFSKIIQKMIDLADKNMFL